MREPGRTADPSAALPGFLFEICGVDAPHASFFTEGAHAALSSAAWQEIRVGMTSGGWRSWDVVLGNFQSFLRD